MAFRSFDWCCTVCEWTQWELVDVPHGERPPKQAVFTCDICEEEQTFDRIVSLVAEYHGEKVLNVPVYGGQFDTMGKRALPSMDMLPTLPADASASDCREQIDAYKERFASSEWKELKKERASIAKENAAKRKRAAAIARGENINMRRDKLSGDPKMTA